MLLNLQLTNMVGLVHGIRDILLNSMLLINLLPLILCLPIMFCGVLSCCCYYIAIVSQITYLLPHLSLPSVWLITLGFVVIDMSQVSYFLLFLNLWFHKLLAFQTTSEAWHRLLVPTQKVLDLHFIHSHVRSTHSILPSHLIIFMCLQIFVTYNF